MRTIPPGEDREEGEGKKPIVVGEPGGLETEREKAQTETVSMERKKNEIITFLVANKACMIHKIGSNFGCRLKMFLMNKRTIRGQ